jgi:hypothetical protein
MKKILILNSFILCSLYLFGQNKTEGFPMNDVTWKTENTSWKNVKQIIFHPENPKKNKVIGQGNILFSNSKAEIDSDVPSSDLKLSVKFVQDANNHWKLKINPELVINFNIKDSESYGALIIDDKTTILPLKISKKSAGLTQNLDIVFSASGVNGKLPLIEKVILNGVQIHSNVVLEASTKKESNISISNLEGSIGIEEFKYNVYENKKPIKIQNLSYTLEETYGFDRSFESKKQAIKSGTTDQLAVDIPNDFDKYILHYKGDLIVEEAGKYGFTIDYQGAASLIIDGKLITGSKEYIYRTPSTGYLELSAGTHKIEYIYQTIFWRAALGLSISGGNFRPYNLHKPNALPVQGIVGGIYISETQEAPKIIRSYMNFSAEKRTKVISVGTKEKSHYAFDLDNGALLYAWKGEFADVTEMWHERGEPQILKPIGTTVKFSGNIPFKLKNTNNSPDIFKEFINQNYTLDQSGLPIYNYSWNQSSFEIKLSPHTNGINYLVSSTDLSKFDYVLAEAKNLEQIDKNLFKIDDYYLKLNDKYEVKITEIDGIKILRTSLNKTLNYSLIW